MTKSHSSAVRRCGVLSLRTSPARDTFFELQLLLLTLQRIFTVLPRLVVLRRGEGSSPPARVRATFFNSGGDQPRPYEPLSGDRYLLEVFLALNRCSVMRRLMSHVIRTFSYYLSTILPSVASHRGCNLVVRVHRDRICASERRSFTTTSTCASRPGGAHPRRARPHHVPRGVAAGGRRAAAPRTRAARRGVRRDAHRAGGRRRRDVCLALPTDARTGRRRDHRGLSAA